MDSLPPAIYREAALDGENTLFIDGTTEDSEKLLSDTGRTHCREIRQYRALAWLVHSILLLVNVAWMAANLKYGSSTQQLANFYEPFDAPIREEQVVRWSLPIAAKSAFTSLNRTSADQAWGQIEMNQNQGWLKVHKTEVDLMDVKSIQFHDGSGYLYGMDVFHQLHCLNYLRKKTILYHDMYPPTAEDEQVPPEHHIPHCIDSIRLSLQCHADLSFIPQRWADGWLEPWPIWTNKHQCRDFQKIRDWAGLNTPDTSGLVHPILGPVASGHINISGSPILQWLAEQKNSPHGGDEEMGMLPDLS